MTNKASSDVRVACLGPIGTYSEDAAISFFGSGSERLLFPTLDQVVAACESGEATHCVLAVENTTEGAVPRALDLLNITLLQVCGEVSLAISHHLLTRSGKLEGVTHVRAHAQALAQCHGWLTANTPHLVREAVLSNAEAAAMASVDAGAAAIASERSATEHGLLIAARAIQDDPANKTRFLVLGKQDAAIPNASRRQKTSLIVSVPNAAGALFRVVEPFARHGVSMSRFESRPTKTGDWEYNFYVDLVGGRLDPEVAAALAELKLLANVKVLGSYFHAAVRSEGAADTNEPT